MPDQLQLALPSPFACVLSAYVRPISFRDGIFSLSATFSWRQPARKYRLPAAILNARTRRTVASWRNAFDVGAVSPDINRLCVHYGRGGALASDICVSGARR